MNSLTIPLIGESVIIALALVVLVFEGWLFAHRRRPEHFWVATMALEMLVMASAMVVHFATQDHETAIWLTRLEAVAINGMVHSMVGFSQAVTGRRIGPRHWLPVSLLFWSVLMLSPLMVTAVEPQVMAWLPQPFLRRKLNPQLIVTHVFAFAMIVLSAAWLYRFRRERPRETRFFLIGVGLWVGLALYSVSRIGNSHAPYPGGMFEYGFCAFAICLVLADATHYVLLLDRSEAAQQNAETQQRATQLLHRQVVESVAEGIVLLDEHGKIQVWNRAMARLTGLSTDDALGQSLPERLPLDRSDRRALVAWLARAAPAAPLELRLGSGTRRRRVECVASPFGLPGSWAGATLVVMRDLTELSDAQQRQARTAKGFLAVVDSAPDPIAICRGSDIVHVNRALLDKLGYRNRDELLGKSYATILAEPETFEGSTAEGPREARWLGPDGVTRDVEVVTLAIEYDGSAATVLIARDVTEQRELTARMMKLDRMIAVGTLAAGVGHEINNPLSYLLLGLQEAQQQLASPDLDPKACTAVLAEAEDAAERIATIVDSLRQLSRAKEAQETVSFVETVRSAIDMTAHQAQHRAVVSHDLETDAAVLANHARLAQVFVNLVMNAVHALPEDGEDNRIEVRAFERERDGQRWVVAEVEDNGAGMAPETLRRIFDPFFTTKPVGVGTGLGLSICQDTVEGLGGRLEAESTQGRGTVMRVILPAAEAAPESTERPRARPVASNDHRMTVLVVDDEKLLLHAIRRALKPHCEVQTARDAQTALKLLDEGLRPDVILTDLMMPRMSGMQLHQEVAGRYPELASTMLFMSGGAFSPESQRFCDSMGERVLAKPLRMAEVVEAILGVDPSPPPHRARA